MQKSFNCPGIPGRIYNKWGIEMSEKKKNITEKIVKFLGGFTSEEIQEQKNKLQTKQRELEAEQNKNDKAESLIQKCQEDMAELVSKNAAEREKEESLRESGKIGLYLQGLGLKKIPDKAYTQKRNIKGKPITIFLNQMITPESYEVLAAKQILAQNISEFEGIKILGKELSKDFTWTDDKNLDVSGDYYLYPEEILVTKKGDCEDHAFCVSSFEPEIIGVAYGFFYPKGKGESEKFGHAWNCALIDNELYNMETTGDTCELTKFWDTTSKYDAYFIITKKGTYEIKSGQEFGYLADSLNDKKTSVDK